MAKNVRNFICLTSKYCRSCQKYITCPKTFEKDLLLKTSGLNIHSVICYSSSQRLSQDSKVISSKNLKPPIEQCCMEGCVNCVWLEYADSLIKEYNGETSLIDIERLLEEIDKDIENPSVRSYIKFEIKSKLL